MWQQFLPFFECNRVAYAFLKLLLRCAVGLEILHLAVCDDSTLMYADLPKVSGLFSVEVTYTDRHLFKRKKKLRWNLIFVSVEPLGRFGASLPCC